MIGLLIRVEYTYNVESGCLVRVKGRLDPIPLIGAQPHDIDVEKKTVDKE